MNMMRINSSDVLIGWNELEEKRQYGIFKRLLNPDIQYLYISFQYPEQYYGIGFIINQDIKLRLEPFRNLRDLKVSLIPDSGFFNSNLLLIQLQTPEFKDIFTSLCGDLIQSVVHIIDEKRRVKAVINQLEKWKTMFDKLSAEGLSLPEQKGLFGELTFLQKILSKRKLEVYDVINLWVGVDYDSVDFKGGTWAVEVKTTTSNNAEEVKISNEKQLDDTEFENLYLYHLSLDESKTAGQSLVEKVCEIKTFLADDQVSLNLFKSKLFQIGYFDKHEHLYNDHFYKMREENLYRVGDDFPRIKQNELRDGVSRVTYYINIANCNEYLVSENQVITEITRL